MAKVKKKSPNVPDESGPVAIAPRFRDKILRRSALSLPPKVAAPHSGIEPKALTQALKDIHGKAEGTELEARKVVLVHLKTTLDEAKDRARLLFESARLGGLETARLLASIHTDILEALYLYTTQTVIRASNPTEAERLALCAVGGFGRAEMAPGSDLDLLFLQTDKKSSAWGESVTEYILYMLWDMGLKVGQSSRTVDQCMSLAKEDQTILTALLDARYIAGDKDMALSLFVRFRREIAKGKGRAYINAKLEERDIRHNREGNSRYVIEPNIKEGKGGLRDLHVLYWIAKYIDTDGQINDPQRASDYVAMGLFDESAADRFVRAADFLWRTRCHLHYTSGRDTEALSFDFQTKLARKMGYASGPVEVAVEKFMREYFTNAREVGALTRIACAKLEAVNSLLLPQGLDRFLPYRRRGVKSENFFIDHGRLSFKDPMQIRENPSQILKLFEIAGRRNIDIHPDALSAIDFRRNLIDNNFRKDPQNAKLFLQTLLGSKAPGAVMKIMNDSGVLGRYLIEFGGIVARTQFNMHHAYTVDEHTIGLVRYYHDLERGDLADENPVATEFVKGFTQSQRRILYLACLLHDTGKGVGDQCIEGARLSRRAGRRMGLDPDEIDTISWLIRRHLDMSETAQRRDISDPDTIKTFAETVGSLERLQMLMALTVVDIRAVGPGIWNDWKGVLLRDLYRATAEYLDDKPNIAPRSRANAARETLLERLPASLRQRVEPVMKKLPDAYWLRFSVMDQVRHARFFDSVLEDGQKHAVHSRQDKPRDVTELWVITQDRKGLFADLTGAISASGASISSARLHTTDEALVFNVFYLQNTDGLAFGRESSHAIDVLRKKTLSAARGETIRVPTVSALPSRRANAIPITPVVRFVDREEKDRVVIEIEGRDRPGLLHALSRVLTDHDLTIYSAHIEAVGVMAVDSFYVQYIPGTDEWRKTKRAGITDDLMRVLRGDDE